MSRIESLTEEQVARFAEFRDKWTAIGLSTEPADRPVAERAIKMMYESAGLKPPETIVWCGSPLSQGITRAIILDKKKTDSVTASVRDSVRASVRASVTDSVRDSVWDSVWDSVMDSVRASVWASVWASVRDSVTDSVTDSVRDSVMDSVTDSVRDSVWASVWASVRDSVWASVRDSVWDSVTDSVFCSHDAGWLSFYNYFNQVVGLEKETEKLNGLWLLAQSAGWAIPCEKVCFISERHNILERDERGRLHNVSGPAVAYPDGWAIYAVHGVRVPADIIEQPESITVDRIGSESNAEIRRVMIELYGPAKYLLDSGAKIVQRDAVGLLYRKEVQDDEPIVMVRVLNSTAESDGVMTRDEAIAIFGDSAKAAIGADSDSRWKEYMIRVPSTIETAHEAVAWTFGLSADEYHPAIES